MREALYACGRAKGTRDIPMTFFQFYCKPKAALKKMSLKKLMIYMYKSPGYVPDF